MSHHDHLAHVRSHIAVCDERNTWGLGADARERYALALAPLLDGLDAELWETVATNYHLDHRAVAALRESDNPDHERAWVRWSLQVLGVLRRQGLDWSRDTAIDSEDLAQVARAELSRALGSYRYRSRFSSWAYSVVVRCAQRQMRAARAARRSAAPGSLDALEEGAAPADPRPRHEERAHGRLLAERVAAALAAHPDRRLAPIFQLWAVEERTSAEIGAIVRLHESRVRALLKQARELLRADPAIRGWADGHEDG